MKLETIKANSEIMEHSTVNKLDLITPAYPTKQLNHSLKLGSKVQLFRRKLLNGYDLSFFQKRGNGINALLEHVGRLTDLTGVYIISSPAGEPLVLSSSKKVIIDVQNLARGKRAKDRAVLERVANFYGFSSYVMGRELLLAMKVNWMEVTDKTYRLMLKRAMIPHVRFVL